MHLISTFAVLLASSLFVVAGLPDYCVTTWTCTTTETGGTVTGLTWNYPLCNGNDIPALELLNGAGLGSYLVSASCPPGSLCIGDLLAIGGTCTITDFGGAPDCFVQMFSQYATTPPVGNGVVAIPGFTTSPDIRGCSSCDSVCIANSPSINYFNVGLIPFGNAPFCECVTTDGCNVQIETYTIFPIVG